LGRRVIIIDEDSTEKREKRICPRCHGTGRDYTTAVFGKPCERCNETGYIPV
jgi:DnaJ-class molecular chaperone